MPSPVVELLAALGAVLDRLGVGWYLFGAQAALIHGAARLTADVDVTVQWPASVTTRGLTEALHSGGFDLRVADDEFVARTRVLPLLHVGTGIPVDLVLAGPGLEERFLARAVRVDLHGIQVPVASAEDLVVMKVLAGRSKDIDDVVAVIAAQDASLDHDYVSETLALLEQALAQSDLRPAYEQAVRRARVLRRRI